MKNWREILGWLCLVLCVRDTFSSIFYHEQSHVVLIPDPGTKHATFGFSMGYQGGPSPYLVSGAPHSSLLGGVFRCPMTGVLQKKSTVCSSLNLDIDKLAPYPKDYAPLHLSLGLSIAATKDYFLTCAPLWSAQPRKQNYSGWRDHSYGTCFVYDGTFHRYKGIFETNLASNVEYIIKNTVQGGIGWKTFVDEKNDFLLLSKLAITSDMAILNASSPLSEAVSLSLGSRSKHDDHLNYNTLQAIRNFGYSIASGNFFNGETLYAVSALDPNPSKGGIYFLYSDTDDHERKLYFKMNGNKLLNISDTTFGAMFGSSMYGADLNGDGIAELIVGASVLDDGLGEYETGAVYLFLGGDKETVNRESRRRMIIGNKNGARFGDAIAVSDIDGDLLPEVFVSAPYEDNGEGAVYILSGFELNQKLLKDSAFKKISLGNLERSQKIQVKGFKNFGKSLLVIPDMDDNGCNELAIGAPGADSVVLLRCLTTINVTVNTELIGNQVIREQDLNFTIRVCLNVTNVKDNFSAKIIVNNAVLGTGAYLDDKQIKYVIHVKGKEDGKNKCTDVIVNLEGNEPGDYSFTTKVEIDQEDIEKKTVFDTKWLTMGPYSKVESSKEISRHCNGTTECDTDLSLNLTWVDMPRQTTYELGSSESITAELLVHNQGSSAFESCLWLRVEGAPVSKIGCVDSDGGYKCYMPKPLRRSSQHKIDIKLNMSQPTNKQQRIDIRVSLFNFCDQPTSGKSYKYHLDLTSNPDNVTLAGISHNQIITDAAIADLKVRTINDAQEYLIKNDGAVTWMQFEAVVSIYKSEFITTYKVSSARSSSRIELEDRVDFLFNFDLKPRSAVKLISITDIAKDKILKNIVDGKLAIKSTISVTLKPDVVLKSKLETIIVMQKEFTLGQNLALIISLAIIGALIGYIAIAYILYKMDFFKRKTKTQLDACKLEHVRRMSVKHSTSGAPSNEHDDLDLEVEDDAFEIVEMTEPVINKDEGDKNRREEL